MFLVVGATGELGGRIVRLLRADGHDVRCLVRDGSDDVGLREVGATVVRGDLTDPPSLRVACEGVDTVIATAAAIARILAGARRPTIRETDEIGMLALVDSAESAGVQRFVYISAPDLDAASGRWIAPSWRSRSVWERHQCGPLSSGQMPSRRSIWHPSVALTWRLARCR